MPFYFCDNQKCFAHVECSNKTMELGRLEFNLLKEMNPYLPVGFGCMVGMDGRVMDLRRHQYRSRQGEIIFLCDICHSAVQMCTGRAPGTGKEWG
jgi:hypothetical protein